MSEEEVLVAEITVAATSYKKGSRTKGGEWHKYSIKSDQEDWYETFDNDVAWEGAFAWSAISNGDELVLRYIVREKNGYVNNIIQSIEDPATWGEGGEDDPGPPEITSDDTAFGGSGKPQPEWGLEFEAPTGNPNKASKATAKPTAEKPAKPKKPAKAAKKPAKAEKPAKAAKPVEKDPVIDESAPPMARCMGEALDLLRAIQGSLPEEVKFSSDALLAATVQLTVALYEKES